MIKNLRINFSAPYPLNIIFDSSSIDIYNSIFRILMQLKKAKFNLTHKDYVIKKPEKNKRIQNFKRRTCFAQRELLNFIDTFEYYFFINIIMEKSKKFLEKIFLEKSLIKIIEMHKQYLCEIADMCLLSKRYEFI